MKSPPKESHDSVRPNFFIVGVPKTGTTALAHYLSAHDNAFISNPKEPFFWDTDHPNSKSLHNMHSLSNYLQLFSGADPARHLAIGEGSTTYMQSRVALKNLMGFNPNAKVIAMLRNPVDVAYGMHGEMLRHFLEDETDFEKAWRLQAERKAGRSLPTNVRMDHQLQYQDVATFAPQLERLFEFVPESQRKIVIFDDFAKDTGKCYREIIDFLGLPDDHRTEFPRVHAAKVFRVQWIGRLYHTPPAILDRPISAFRKWYAGYQGGAKKLMSGMVSKEKPREPLRPEFREELREVFRPDIEAVSEMLGRDLNGWVTNKSLTQVS